MKTGLQKSIAIPVSTVFVTALFVFPLVASAVTSLQVTPNAAAGVENRFIVGPAKLEATVAAGDTDNVVVDLENRTGRVQTYTFSFEDFVASSLAGEPVKLVSDGGTTSLKNFLSVPQRSITLEQGDRVRLPISISIPFGVTPGGYFGALVVSANVASPMQGGGNTSTAVVGQTATLIFVTVPGNVVQAGSLATLSIGENKKVFFGTPADLQIAFHNTGTVNLDPYGGVVVKDMFGRVVSTTPIDPWFVLPSSTRTRDVSLSTKHLFGTYTATLQENRGYGDVIDTASVSFVALSPISLVFAVAVILILALLVLRRKK